MPHISSIPEGTTWEEFKVKYRKFFPISFEPKAIEAMEKEYTRLTGKPVHEKKSKRRFGRNT
jgi:hypothetical protein